MVCIGAIRWNWISRPLNLAQALTAVRLTTIIQMPQIAQTACRTYVDGGCRRDRHTEAIQVLLQRAGLQQTRS